ncbi:MAG: hypothetical protein ACPGVB_00525 [Chitinophagales bacterium]
MRIPLLYINLFFCLCSVNIVAQIPSNIPVEAFIDQLTSKVVKDELRLEQIELIRPLTLALGNAKVNLMTYLDEEIGETPVDVLSVLVSLNDIVNQFTARTYFKSSDLKRQISELPFYTEVNKELPSINHLSPKKLLLVGSSVDMSLKGHFLNVQKEDFHASIVLSISTPITSTSGFTSHRNSMVTIMPLEKKTDLIRFQLPLEYFAMYKNKMGLIYLNLDLGVPQKSEDSLLPRKVRYTLPFKLLPSSPGSIYLSYQQTSDTKKKEVLQTRTFVQHSTNKFITENYYIPQKEKERISYESAKLVVEWSDGKQDRDWSYYKHKTSKGICFTVETVYNPVGISGKLNFHIEYEVEKHTSNTTQKSASVDLDWNDYQRFDIGYDTKWKIDFTDYQGSLHTYRQPINSEFLNITKSGKNLIVTTSGVESIKE